MAEGCLDLAYKKQKDSDLLRENIFPKGTEDRDERNITEKIHGSIQLHQTFPIYQCSEIERNIEQVISDVDKGKYKPCTVDRSRLRNKYFFGERYTYGDGLGQEMLFPIGEVDPIPLWITRLVISPLEVAGILPLGFTNSAVINLYLPGGCIVSHVDPPHIFDRPIVSVSFLSDCVLSFGCKFTYKPIRATPPVTTVPLRRGSVLSMSGFAADGITHCIRPQDVKARRAAIILRRVLPDAPRMSWSNYSFITGVLRGFSTIYRMPRKRTWEECEKQLPVWTRKRARFDIKQYHGN